jgi:hypothetical protein
VGRVRIKLGVQIVFMAMIFLLWNPMDASACSCIMPPPPEDALNEADAVFSGEVVEIIENGKFTKGYGKIVHIKVDEVWKGINDSEVVITTGNNDGDCGYPFEKGRNYLIYASKSDMYVNNSLSTTICNRTTQIASAAEDLKAIGEGQIATGHESNVEDEQSLQWWVYVMILLAFTAVFAMYKVKKDKSKTRS